MDENTKPWEENVPADLLPAIKHLRKSFEKAHWAWGWSTKALCYAVLHDDALEEAAKEYHDSLMRLKLRVGPAATQRFHDVLKQGIPPAIFKGFYDLYLEGMSVQVLLIFEQLIEIGRANEKRLNVPHLEWAETQVINLIRYYSSRIESWVRDVCDKHVYDPNEDMEERIFWRKWQAPMLLVMKPSQSMLYEASRAWERTDVETSVRWLKVFSQHYVLHLEVILEKAAGEAALELAKQPKSAESNGAEEKALIIAASASKGAPKSLSPMEQHRRSVIFGAIQSKAEGRDYCTLLDQRRLPIPARWVSEGCPITYAKAYIAQDKRWRQRINDEKFRYAKKYNLTSPREREKLIQQADRTR